MGTKAKTKTYNFTDETHHKLKVIAANENIQMSQTLKNLIDKYYEENYAKK